MIVFATTPLMIPAPSVSPWISEDYIPLYVGITLGLIALIAGIQAWRWRSRHSHLSSDLEQSLEGRERAEIALHQAEVFYHSLVETIPQMITCKDLDGKIIFANQKFCDTLGLPHSQIEGKTDFDFYPRELAEKYRADDRSVIESGKVLDVVEENVSRTGEKIYVQVMKAPLRDRERNPIGIQLIFWDVTERMQSEEKLKQQNMALQELARSEREAHQALKSAQSRMVQTEKLASLGQLVAGVAHEINNPLAFVSNNIAVLERDLADMIRLIKLYRELAASGASDQPEIRSQIDQIAGDLDLDYAIESLPQLITRTREGLRRIERIVKDLRLFARVDEGEWNEVDLNPGIESSVNMVRGYARKNQVQLEMDLGALTLVRCKGAKIHQVIVNLLMNAIDACSANGTVTVRTGVDAEKQQVWVEVADTGTGMDAKTLDRIFDPFFTTKPVGQGTGLGLSISYGIVDEHDGTIDVQSTPGVGSTFTMRIPVEPERSRGKTQRASFAASGSQEADLANQDERPTP